MARKVHIIMSMCDRHGRDGTTIVTLVTPCGLAFCKKFSYRRLSNNGSLSSPLSPFRMDYAFQIQSSFFHL